MIPLELPEPQDNRQGPASDEALASNRSENIQPGEPPADDVPGPLARVRKIGKAYVFLDLILKAGFLLVFGVAAVAAVLVAIVTGDFRLLAEGWPIALIFLGLFWLAWWIRRDANNFNEAMRGKQRPRFEFQEEQRESDADH